MFIAQHYTSTLFNSADTILPRSQTAGLAFSSASPYDLDLRVMPTHP